MALIKESDLPAFQASHFSVVVYAMKSSNLADTGKSASSIFGLILKRRPYLVIRIRSLCSTAYRRVFL